MTPDKPPEKCEHTGPHCQKCGRCEHWSPQMTWNDTKDAPEWACDDCGMAFVPSDVLEELRALALQGVMSERCVSCGEKDGHVPGCFRGEVLRRIDGVLGK